LLDAVFKEYGFDESCRPVFALWLVSDELSLQLKKEHKVLHHMAPKKWANSVERWGTPLEGRDARKPSKPRLVFRHNAHCPLAEEKKAGFNDKALYLLYEEARGLFLRGFYPCDAQDAITLAAISLAIIYGPKHTVSAPNLKVVMPPHLANKEPKRTLMNIAKEYETLQNQNLLSLQLTSLFDAQLYLTKPFQTIIPVRVGVNDDGIHVINDETKALVFRFSLQHLVWTPPDDKPYIDMQSPRIMEFRIATKQAAHIHQLLSTLCGKPMTPSSPPSSASISAR
ncbi:unnamed protein product, partial [Mesorhabditis spiculigera]